MQFKVYTDVKTFYHDTYPILMRHEAQNLIPLGNIIIGNDGRDTHDWRDPANWFMATVSEGGDIKLTAVMTPPHNLTLYATDNHFDHNAIACLLAQLPDSIPGVMTEKSLALAFAELYTQVHKMQYKTTMNQRIYELTAVNPNVPTPGSLRLLRDEDMCFFPYWLGDFTCDVEFDSNTVSSDDTHYRYRIAKKNIYVLEIDNTPVSMACTNREMQTVCGVALVYTPPYFRGRGYASSCVAQLSQLILSRGFKRCVLYTDLANPTSNSIYQKIGYSPICDSLELKFV